MRIADPRACQLKRGKADFGLLPASNEGAVELSSEWADPSFFGDMSPSEQKVSDEGFTASWAFGKFGRAMEMEWRGQPGRGAGFPGGDFFNGVELLDTVDAYRLTERSLKYGLLFVGLSFGVFFFFETVSSARLHAAQYFLVGTSQVIFFLLLLALSEVLHFGVAYAIAVLASVCLAGFYSLSMLKRKGRAIAVGAVLGGVYGLQFIVLRLQDFALLAGSALVFSALASFMYLTRDVDWGRVGRKRLEAGARTG